MLIRRRNTLPETARRNRLEIIKAGLGRRDLFTMGLLTSAGYLVAKRGLSSRASADSGAVRSGASVTQRCSPRRRSTTR